MVYKKQITKKQRVSKLIELIKDAKSMGFNKQLTNGFKEQLKGLQAELKADKERVKQFNSNLLKEQELKKVGDTKPLVPQLNALSVA